MQALLLEFAWRFTQVWFGRRFCYAAGQWSGLWRGGGRIPLAPRVKVGSMAIEVGGVFPADVLSWSSSIAALLKAFGRYNFCWPGSCCRFLLSPAMSSTAERDRGGGHGR